MSHKCNGSCATYHGVECVSCKMDVVRHVTTEVVQPVITEVVSHGKQWRIYSRGKRDMSRAAVGHGPVLADVTNAD